MTTNLDIPEKYKIFTIGSKGSQLKYKKDNIWYKIDTLGVESTAECLVSLLLSCSGERYVNYRPVRVNNRSACASKSFTSEEECFISFEDLYYRKIHKSLTNDIRTISNVEERYRKLLQIMNGLTHLDLQRYLDINLSLDFLILNPDRHMNNLGVVITPSGSYKEAPIFDNGQSLGANWNITPPYLSYEECLDKLTAGTISGSFTEQLLVVKNVLTIDYSNLEKSLTTYPLSNRCLTILTEQLNKYKKIFAK